jgi:hypothetical protein
MLNHAKTQAPDTGFSKSVPSHTDLQTAGRKPLSFRGGGGGGEGRENSNIVGHDDY